MKAARRALSVSIGVVLLCLAGCSKGTGSQTGNPQPPDPAPAQPNSPAQQPKDEQPADLLRARAGFQTRVSPNPNYQSDGPVDQPPPKWFRLVQYPAPPGNLAAYLSPDPGDGKKHPAVVYAHGGFGGINGFQWGRESFAPFRDAGFVLFCPSCRGENENPGRYEMFYGEVDDALAAIDYVAKVPYVDPARVYMVGHSTGGTITLLAAESSPRLRAAFSFGGAPDLQTVDYGNTPFDRRVAQEVRLRSPIHFVAGLKTPTFYFEGDRDAEGKPDEGYIPDALRMQTMARQAKVPLSVYPVKGGNHWSIVRPIITLLAGKLSADTGPSSNVPLTQEEVNAAFAAGSRGK
jgi:dipeptidyl aminopeptidase/acylaminoacyl peptidase